MASVKFFYGNYDFLPEGPPLLGAIALFLNILNLTLEIFRLHLYNK